MRWGDRVTNSFKWGHMSWPKPTTSQMSIEPANATKAQQKHFWLQSQQNVVLVRENTDLKSTLYTNLLKK